MKDIVLKFRIQTVDGMKMPFRVDFDDDVEFDEAVTEWNKNFREDFKW